MKKLLAAVVCLTAILMAETSHAAVINPATGASGIFSWNDGLGPIDFIDGIPDSSWSIVLLQQSTISVFVDDCCVPGDAFGLVVDGAATAWTSSGFPGGVFHGEYIDLLLSAGAHSLSLDVTALAPGFTSGDGFYRISAATAVPEPASMLLLGLGLAAAGARRFRRHNG